MAVTIHECALAAGMTSSNGDGTYTKADYDKVRVPMFGGCGSCGESLAAYNAYPSQYGSLRCKADIGDDGFENTQAFWDWVKEMDDAELKYIKEESDRIALEQAEDETHGSFPGEALAKLLDNCD